MSKKISLPVLYFIVGLMIVLFSLGEMCYVGFTGQPAFWGLFPCFQNAAIAVVTAFSLVLLAVILPRFVSADGEDLFKTCLKAAMLLIVFFVAETVIYISFYEGVFLTAIKILGSLVLNLVATLFVAISLFIFGYIKKRREDESKEN